MEINKNTLTEFRRDFKEAVAGLEEKYGVTISLGSISYSENDFTSKLTVNNGHDKDDIAQREFDRDVWKYAHLGLGKGMYKRIFIGLDGNRYAILGFNTKAPKYPLIIRNIRESTVVRAPEGFIKELTNEYYAENFLL